MKKIGSLILFLVLAFSLSACAENSNKETSQKLPSDSSTESMVTTEEESAETEEHDETEEISGNHVLIAYFGRWGNTEFPDDVDASASASIVIGRDGNLQGTTEYVADLIREYVGGDMHLIQTVEPYSEDYDTVVEKNRQEQEEGVVPELQSTDLDIEQYDTIFIGYPIWATTIPRPIVSFLSQYNLMDKTIIPFCTHAGYGSGSSYADIQELCPNSEVLTGLAVEAEEISSAEQEVSAWLGELQLVQAEDTTDTEASQIVITVDDVEILAELNDSEAAKEFGEMLPLTVSMTRMGEHEYYGGLETPLTHTADVQTGYAIGDLAFWTPGNLFAVYFDEPDDDPEGLMILGHIISDMSVFDNLEGSVEMQIDFLSE